MSKEERVRNAIASTARVREYASFGAAKQQVNVPILAQTQVKAKNNKGSSFANVKIYGFRAKESMPWMEYASCGPAYMIYPTDEVVAGSREAFCHLHASMLRKGVIAIGEKVLRTSWPSKLVAIVPMAATASSSSTSLDEEEGDEEESSGPKQPACMMVVDLPFEDDVRVLEPDYSMQERQLSRVKGEALQEEVDADGVDLTKHLIGSVASDSLVEAAKKLISQQTLSKELDIEDAFENRAVKKFINFLESVALGTPFQETEEDWVDFEGLKEIAKEEIKSFDCLLPEDIKAEKPKTERKRKIVADESGIDWNDLLLNDGIAECKIDELKSYLRSVGEKVGGKKVELVERVTSHLQANSTKRVKTEG